MGNADCGMKRMRIADCGMKIKGNKKLGNEEKMKDNDKIDLSMFLDDYLNDAKEGFQAINRALLALEKDKSQTGELNTIFRHVHTLKSSSTMLEFTDIAGLAHTCEDLLDRLRKDELPITQGTIDVLFEVTDTLETMVREPNADWGLRNAELKKKFAELELRNPEKESEISIPKSAIEKSEIRNPKSAIETVRVHAALLDSLFNQMGELIITKNRIDNIVADTANKELKAALTAMDYIITELQENVSAARLVPAGEIFQKFPRMVRDLAKERDKEIELVLEGSEIELDKAVLDAISEPLIHLIRNAADHGIEPPDIRQKQKKKRSGTLKIAAKRAENHIIIEVEEDGGGIDAARMKEVAVRKGFVNQEEVESLEDNDVLNLLFKPGFSSVEEVTDVSGRGVGLDVVKTSVSEIGGTVDVATEKGKGTRFTLQLPLTTAIMQTLMVGIGNHIFAIPSDIIVETLEVKPEEIKEIHNEQVLVLRNEAIPFVMLQDVLNIPHQEDRNELIAVIIYWGDTFIGLGVDTLVDQTENIIKPFDPIAQQFKGFSGGTILGDGSVALLLDIPGLFDFGTKRMRNETNAD
jgi:two-component system chemotaxis sensor kinase CheA